MPVSNRDSQKDEAAYAAFSFFLKSSWHDFSIAHKKVGVPADLVLVSTKKGDARVGEATPERLGATSRSS